MIVRILGAADTLAYKLARETVERLGHQIDDGLYFYVDLAIGPLLTSRLDNREQSEPRHGTLIFHPSPLPYGRGASAIKWAYKRREPVTAATWFWCNDGKMDSGDICEQESITIDYSKAPRQLYEEDVLPALVRTLERALKGLAAGNVRRVPQVERYATFDPRL